MFETVKNKVQKSTLIELLKFIVAATLSEAGHGFALVVDLDKLAKAEPDFIVIDKETKNDAGQVKVTATEKAIAAINAPTQSTPAATGATEQKSATVAMDYEIGTLTVMPEIRRGGHKSDSYPFEKLNAFPQEGNYFFVPATAARPKPSKSLASTVASANKRYAAKGLKFTLRKKVDTTGQELGAIVIREK